VRLLALGEAELDAIVSDLKAESPEASWAELMRGHAAGPRMVIGLLEEQEIGRFANGVPAPPSGGFVLYVGGDRSTSCSVISTSIYRGRPALPESLEPGRGGVASLGLHTDALAVWAIPLRGRGGRRPMRQSCEPGRGAGPELPRPLHGV